MFLPLFDGRIFLWESSQLLFEDPGKIQEVLLADSGYFQVSFRLAQLNSC